MLRGRHSEREVLDRRLQRVRVGESAVLVVRGEAGVGKTALLEYVAERASGCRIVRVAGVESEMELAFAGLHQLCAPMLDGLDGLPGPQRDALRVAFGLHDGAAPNGFLVALAVLSLLADAAEVQPLVCLVDDAHWLDGVDPTTTAPGVEQSAAAAFRCCRLRRPRAAPVEALSRRSRQPQLDLSAIVRGERSFRAK
jgi:AAA ATPase domain